MPSSTSSSDTADSGAVELNSVVPEHQWFRLMIASVVLTAACTLGWESYWRSQGYTPSVNDTPDLWADVREQVDANPTGTVLIGSSRILYGFDLGVYEQAFGQRPMQLATVGTSGSEYLHHLADSEFAGTVIVGVSPGLYFAPGGPPVARARENVQYYRDRGPAKRISHTLSMMLERRFAFLEPTDLPLEKLLRANPLPTRAGARLPPLAPPHFYHVNEERQAAMTAKAEKDATFQQVIKERWIPLFTPPPPPKNLSPEVFGQKMERMLQTALDRSKESVDKIRARGGRVVFVRYPSTGTVRELERKFTPRAMRWDRLLKATNAPGIHFEDHSELSGFECPEWSHLTRADATTFTTRLIPHLRRALADDALSPLLNSNGGSSS